MTARESKCTTCGSFKPRLNPDSEAIQNILLANYDFSALAEIQETISLLNEDYQERASEITRLQLQQEESKLCQLNLRSLLPPSPTRKLPNEVLMYIFNYVSQDNLLQRPFRRSDLVYRPAMLLSSVCSQWRQIALSCSILWSRISLTIWVGMESRLTPLAMILKLYLERSGISLLRLTIVTKGCYDEPDYVASLPLTLLGQHSHRWQYLHFCHLVRRALFSLPDNAIHEFPMLEELEFESADIQSLQVFEQAPKLRSLAIESRMYGSSTFPFAPSRFPFRQLTSLAVAATCDTEVAKLTDCCPNLISLKLRLVGELEDSLLPNPARPFKHLRSLSFVVISAHVLDVLNGVLSSLSCPSLTSLTVECSDYESSTWVLDVLESFLIRSSCALTSLSIQGFMIPDNDLVTVFKQLSSLTSLIIEDHHCSVTSGTFTHALIQSLHSFTSTALQPPSTPPLLPKLSHLSLAYAGNVFDDAGFVDMIQSRCLLGTDAQRQGIEPLRSLVLTSLHRTSDFLDGVAEIYKLLCCLEENGFRVIVKGILDSEHLN